MSQREIETILARHLASYLAMPMFIAGPDGSLIYYNEQAGIVLGHPFEESSEQPLHDRLRALNPTSEDGEAIPPEQMPLAIAVSDQCPSQRRLWIRGLDGVSHHIQATAFPLIGLGGRHTGAISIFWEIEEK